MKTDSLDACLYCSLDCCDSIKISDSALNILFNSILNEGDVSCLRRELVLSLVRNKGVNVSDLSRLIDTNDCVNEDDVLRELYSLLEEAEGYEETSEEESYEDIWDIFEEREAFIALRNEDVRNYYLSKFREASEIFAFMVQQSTDFDQVAEAFYRVYFLWRLFVQGHVDLRAEALRLFENFKEPSSHDFVKYKQFQRNPMEYIKNADGQFFSYVLRVLLSSSRGFNYQAYSRAEAWLSFP